MDIKHSCRCCLRCAPNKDLTTPYTHLGVTETYADMLQQCFDIHLVLADDSSRGICLACVGRLRDARDFKLQVLRSQEELQGALLDKVEPAVKPELAGDSEEDDSVSDVLYEEPIEKLEMVSEDETGGVLEEMPGAGIEDGDRTSEDNELMSYGELLIKPEMNDADEDETSDDMLHGELLIKPEMNDADEDETSDEMLPNPGGGATTAREQLAMACSVVLERLPGDATVHRRNKPYTCEHCGKCFRNKSILRKHIRHTHLSTGPKQFSCDFGISSFQTKLLVVEHEKTEHGVTNFMCAECEYITVNKKSLVTHLKSHTIKNIFSYFSPDKTHLHKHQIIDTREQPFKCSNCDFKCRQKEDLQRHQRIHTTKKPYKCSHCNYKCSHRSNLQRHEMTHTGAKPFRCCDCDYKCSRKESLIFHQRKHTGEKPFTCSHCDYKCSRKLRLQRHEMTHTGAKPFRCCNCDYKSSRKDYLLIHQKKHTGEKPYKCSHCDYKCSTKSHLQTHQVVHTGAKPFKCWNCEYKCSRKYSLLIHQRKHTGEKPYKCSHCDYGYSEKSYVREHERTHTGEKAS